RVRTPQCRARRAHSRANRGAGQRGFPRESTGAASSRDHRATPESPSPARPPPPDAPPRRSSSPSTPLTRSRPPPPRAPKPARADPTYCSPTRGRDARRSRRAVFLQAGFLRASWTDSLVLLDVDLALDELEQHVLEQPPLDDLDAVVQGGFGVPGLDRHALPREYRPTVDPVVDDNDAGPRLEGTRRERVTNGVRSRKLRQVG